MDNGDEILRDILETQEIDEAVTTVSKLMSEAPTPPPQDEAKEAKSDKENHSQWALGGNGRFMPVGSTTPRLPAGIYEPFATPGMWGLELLNISSDGIYKLPDMATDIVMDEIEKFWNSEERYKKHNLLYRRGVILWGPAGSGKTICCKMLMASLVAREGVVIIASNINLTIMCLKAIRRIEPDRNIILMLEDIDEIINYNGEAVVLSMLDGEHNIDRILHVATTNHPDRLGARIINRPSRFDRRVYVGMPESDARRVYLEKASKNGLSSEQLSKWVTDTEGMSIAHLRELVAAVYCLDQPYEDVLERLKAMAIQVKGEEEFKRKGLGFKSGSNQGAVGLAYNSASKGPSGN